MKHIKTITTNNLRSWNSKENKYEPYFTADNQRIVFSNRNAFIWFKKAYNKPYFKCQKGIVEATNGFTFKINPTNIKVYAV